MRFWFVFLLLLALLSVNPIAKAAWFLRLDLGLFALLIIALPVVARLVDQSLGLWAVNFVVSFYSLIAVLHLVWLAAIGDATASMLFDTLWLVFGLLLAVAALSISPSLTLIRALILSLSLVTAGLVALEFSLELRFTTRAHQAPAAWFFNPNDLACFQALVLAFGLSLPKSKRFDRSWLMVLVFSFSAFIIITTQSRLGLMLLAGCAGFALLRHGKTLGLFLVACLALVILFHPFWPSDWSRGIRFAWVALGEDPSIAVRVEMISAAWQNWQWSLVGAGPRSYQASLIGSIDAQIAFSNVHAFLVELNLAYGILAWVLFLALSSWPLYIAAKWVIQGRVLPAFCLTFVVLVFLATTFGPSSFFRYHYWLVLPYLTFAVWENKLGHS